MPYLRFDNSVSDKKIQALMTIFNVLRSFQSSPFQNALIAYSKAKLISLEEEESHSRHVVVLPQLEIYFTLPTERYEELKSYIDSNF